MCKFPEKLKERVGARKSNANVSAACTGEGNSGVRKGGITRVAVVGSRTFTNYNFLKETLDSSLMRGDVIVSGGAKGADSLARLYASERGFLFSEIRADWKQHGRSAGYVRNYEILKNVDRVIVFLVGSSPGSLHMIRNALSLGLAVNVWRDGVLVTPSNPGLIPGDDWESGLHSKSGYETLEEAFNFSPDAFRPPSLHPFDRIIYEEGNRCSDGSYIFPHLRNSHDNCVSYLRPEFISRRAHCSLPEAIRLADYFSIIDPTYEMVLTFCRWTRRRGATKALVYFGNLALELGLVEATSDVLDEAVPYDESTNQPLSSEPSLNGSSPFAYHRIGSLPARLASTKKSKSIQNSFPYLLFTFALQIVVVTSYHRSLSFALEFKR